MADATFFQTLFTSAWGILLVLLFFNGSIVIHELGHFLAARWRGLRVDRFSLFGLGPKLVSWKGKDGVEYCICAIPFGAYVALPQMAEMSGLEGENENKEPLPPIGYADKMYVAFAGPFFNLVLAVLVACIGWYTGYPTLSGSENPQIGYVSETLPDGQPSPAMEAGLKEGDQIIAIDGEPVSTFKEIPEIVALGDGRDEEGNPKTVFLIERDGERQEITVQPKLVLNNTGSKDKIRMVGIGSTVDMTVSSLIEDFPAQKAGMQLGDKVLSVNGERVYSTEHVNKIISRAPKEPATIEVQRGDEIVSLEIKPLAVPTQKPAVRITLDEEQDPAFIIIPQYQEDMKQDPASPEAPSQLAVFTLKPGESILDTQGDWRIAEVDGQAVASLAQLLEVYGQHSGEDPVMLTLSNDSGRTRKRELPASATLTMDEPNERFFLGFSPTLEVVMIPQNPIEQFQEHIERTFRTLGSLISPESDIGMRHLSGVVGITANLYRISQMDWRMALWFAVLLNINLAILNLLPIPVLDGGHMAIATFQKFSGRAMPQSVIFGVQYIFVFLLLGVMFYVLYFDSMREVGHHEARQKYERSANRMIQTEYRPERYD